MLVSARPLFPISAFAALFAISWSAPSLAQTGTASESSAQVEADTPRLRGGAVPFVSFGPGLSKAQGYPNNPTFIDDPRYYSSSDTLTGTSLSLGVLGALTDWLNIGFGMTFGSYKSNLWESNNGGIGLRLEAFPLVHAFPTLENLGFYSHLGLGYGRVAVRLPGKPDADGTESYFALGAFHEWSVAKMLGGHLALGPQLEFDYVDARSFDQQVAWLGLRVAYYGGK